MTQNETLTYFNENDSFASKWLKKLYPTAVVDDRSIVDVKAEDALQFKRCHFFGGIGGWELALQLAGWPVDREVWTGSCPCQPFSVAGKGKGKSDERHLWPEFLRLIEKRRPATIFGEQVAGKDGLDWLAGVRADLEALGYAVGGADLCAAGTGTQGEGWIVHGDQAGWERLVISAPHIRQRLYWVADAGGAECRWGSESSGEHGRAFHAPDGGRTGGVANAGLFGRQGLEATAEQSGSTLAIEAQSNGGYGRLGNANVSKSGRREQRLREARGTGDGSARDSERQETDGLGNAASRGLGINGSSFGNTGHVDQSGQACRMVHTSVSGLEGHTGDGDDGSEPGRLNALAARYAAAASHLGAWSRFDLIPCLDEKTRRVESGTFPLADGVPNRVGRLRGYGNAIVVPQAAEFIRAFIEVLNV
jgi:DNA (cytosine-5)-methyltransferase 1